MLMNSLYYETHVKKDCKEWLLLVHGAGGSTRTWKRQIKDLGASYNLLVVELPGHGNNKNHDLGLTDYSFEIVANKIWEIVDYLNIQSIHLVGISLGAIVCLQMRILRPHHVSSVILPGAIIRLSAKLRILARVSLAFAKIIGYRNFYNLSAYIMMPRGNHKQSRDIFIKESKALTTAEFKKWTYLYFDLNKKLHQLYHAKSTIPHLIVMGSQDHLFKSHAEAYSEFHDNAQFLAIQNCGHVVSIEKASEFNQICLEFLKSNFRQA